MISIEWDGSIAIGIASIDQDHKKLVDLLNELFAAGFAAMGPEMIDKILADLLDYTKYHFEREEALLAEVKYSKLDGHKAEHQNMIRRLQQIIREREQKGATHDLSNDTLKFLSHWLTDHIKAEDKEFGAILRAAKVN